MRNHRQLYGLVFLPSASNIEEYDKRIHSADYAVESDFRKVYQNHMAAMEIVAMSAKIYAVKNWEKVKDWSDLDISIVDNTGKETHYYKYVESANLKRKRELRKEGHFVRLLERMEKEGKKNQNHVKNISGVALDTTDGDFSLTIHSKKGNKDHLWIDDESVIVLADYIEKQITKSAK